MRKIFDLFWNYRSVIIPGITTLLCVFWFFSDRSWEPFIVFVGALITTILAYQQLAEGWRFAPGGDIYSMDFRGNPLNVLDEFQEKVLALDPGILKWKSKKGPDGDHRILTIDVIGDFETDEIFNISRSLKGNIYWITKNGKVIWEHEEP
ncbi:MAG: hypothetical protein HOD92_13555 [Deltaproteobacteria bacterium]|jgi:hypothetical protein|nr:hypothetical protein [Deltaproteobacteria bacterium]